MHRRWLLLTGRAAIDVRLQIGIVALRAAPVLCLPVCTPRQLRGGDRRVLRGGPGEAARHCQLESLRGQLQALSEMLLVTRQLHILCLQAASQVQQLLLPVLQCVQEAVYGVEGCALICYVGSCCTSNSACSTHDSNA